MLILHNYVRDVKFRKEGELILNSVLLKIAHVGLFKDTYYVL